MKIKTIGKRLLCLVIAVVLMFGASFSASATEVENTNISDSGNSTNVEEEKTRLILWRMMKRKKTPLLYQKQPL